MDAFVQIVGVTALAFLTKKVVERLVKWFSFLQGDLITLAGVAVGTGLAWLFPGIDPIATINAAVGSPIRDLPDFVVDVILGVIIAMAAGYLADREELRFGVSQAAGESVTAAVPEVVTFDEGYNPGDPGYNPETKTFDPTYQPPAH